MKLKLRWPIAFVTTILLCAAIYWQDHPETEEKTSFETYKANTSGAGEALDMWSFERSYPNDNIPVSKYAAAFAQQKTRTSSVPGEWESLGPENIGGRILCLAFHPTDPDIIFAGSASGGLWKTTSRGVGRFAWEPVTTGFPVLGVGAIAIDQNDPDVMYIGTGETYGVSIAEPGLINRLTRGTYGIGILKTTDGGTNWTQVLPFDADDIKGVQDIEISNQNSNEIFAATTDGVYRSLDAGASWTLVFSQPNCIDVEVDPNNGDVLYVSQGNFNFNLDPNLSGIFKSTNKGNSFTELLDAGLITAWSGNAKLAIDPANSNTIYASIQVGWFNTGATTPAGIFRSTNGGTNWSNINNQNIAFWQGWYSHDIAINPNNTSEIINVGLDAWKSTNTGTTFVQKSFWQNWDFGLISVDQPEGGPDYIHADIHAVYYHPLVNDVVFYATDGGVFSSDDGGETFVTHNGGLQTTQFYANMGSSATNPAFCIGGTQDNASYVWRGDPSWWRVIGGDGMSASVRQDDDNIVFGSAQGLNLFKSTDNGNTFLNRAPNLVANDYTAFSAPYEIAPTDNDIMYAGGTWLYKSTDSAENWSAISNQAVDGSNVILKIAVSHQNPNFLYVTTAPDPFSGTLQPKVFRSTNGGQTFSVMTGLPNRICKDIEFDPTDDSIAYSVFSGFGTSHVYQTTDGGGSWNAIDNGLADVPTNSILIDPLNTDNIYLGNDLGVFFSEDFGVSWEPFNELLPEATIAMDLDISPVARKIRVATHGHGIYQRNFVNDPLSVSDQELAISSMTLHPNPVRETLFIDIQSNTASQVSISIYDILGRKIETLQTDNLQAGQNHITWEPTVGSGLYFVRLEGDGLQSISKKFIVY